MVEPYFATLEEDSWTLDDGEKLHRAHPDTFWIPSLQERESLRVGDLVKLRFLIVVVDDDGNEEEGGERMWVEVEKCHQVYYQGELTNQPACTDEVMLGMVVWFEPRHVIDIMTVAEQESRRGGEGENGDRANHGIRHRAGRPGDGCRGRR